VGWLHGWGVFRAVGWLHGWGVFRAVGLLHGWGVFRGVGWLHGWGVSRAVGWLHGWGPRFPEHFFLAGGGEEKTLRAAPAFVRILGTDMYFIK